MLNVMVAENNTNDQYATLVRARTLDGAAHTSFQQHANTHIHTHTHSHANYTYTQSYTHTKSRHTHTK